MPLFLAADEEIRFSAWKLVNPTSDVLKTIEQKGGRVASYYPGRSAVVYLPEELKSFLVNEGFLLENLNALEKAGYDQNLVYTNTIGESYHSYESVLSILDSFYTAYSDISKIETIGLTEQGRSIKAFCLTDNPAIDEAEPEVRLIGNMHGNEIITQEIMLCAIDSMLKAYGSDPLVTGLIDQTEIWIIPNMNYDGAKLLSRFNANGIDLNRDFPDREYDEVSDPAGRQSETRAVMEWSENHHFVLSANFHAGAMLVNYPWDKNLTGQSGYAATPDDELFIRLALAYAEYNMDIYTHPVYEHGIVNGALWYDISGSMQDWSYHFKDNFEVTVELCDSLQPAAYKIKNIWRDNSTALFNYIRQVHSGIKGIVTDSLQQLPLAARIDVLETEKPVYSNSISGEYYRLLEPGSYNVCFSAYGYLPKTFQVEIDTISPLVLDVELCKETFYTLSGLIVDSLAGQPIEDVLLKFYRNNTFMDSVRSLGNGSFELQLPVGKYLVNTCKNGYFALNDSLVLEDDLYRHLAIIPILPTAVKGTIVTPDGGNGSAAIVYCQGKTDTIFSGNAFQIADILAGRIKVFTFKYGYTTAYIDTPVANGDTLTLQIYLEKGMNEFTEDFDNDITLFSVQQDWERGTPVFGPDYAYSGSRCFGTKLDDNYSKGPLLSSLISPFIFIQGMDKPVAEFYHWFSIESGYDGGNIKISVDEGSTWQLLDPRPGYSVIELSDEYHNPLGGQPAYSDHQLTWEKVTINLYDYLKYPALLFRFDFGSDEQKTDAGWYIDDFHVYDGNATKVAAQEFTPDDYALNLHIYPNPANPSAKVLINGIKINNPLRIKVYTILGELIYAESIPSLREKQYLWEWKGKNLNGSLAASGLYFIKIENGGKTKTSKLVLIR
ncbi:MAG: T9SS type A sorting domain-containing protein [Calditrichaceae bacterium]|nr:T9SS type A sorting domain-containing protein [Calditrichaceae bacterium]MBN2707621.1 T9SS type A sorting domain-containing protein [Calditrichaceae bacterium]